MSIRKGRLPLKVGRDLGSYLQQSMASWAKAGGHEGGTRARNDWEEEVKKREERRRE